MDGLLGEIGDIDHFVRGLREGRETTVVLGYFHSLGATWLQGIVGPLVGEFPQARIELFVSDTFESTRRPRPDVQLIVTPRDFEPPAGYSVLPLAQDPYVVALPGDHALASRPEIALTDLAGESWVDNDVARGWCRQVVVDACAAAGFQPRYGIEAHDYATALSLVEAGLGVSVMPSLGARLLPEGLVAVPIAHPVPMRAIGALVREDYADTALVRRIIALSEERASRAGVVKEGRSPQR